MSDERIERIGGENGENQRIEWRESDERMEILR
jgi:hypothetical protein